MAERDRVRVRISATRTTAGVRQPFADEEGATRVAAEEGAFSRGDVRMPVFDLEDAGLEIDIDKAQIGEIISERIGSITSVYRALDTVAIDLRDFFPAVPELLPPAIDGRLLNPDGTGAAYVSVEAVQPASDAAAGAIAWIRHEAQTDRRGAFRLALPSRPVPDAGLELKVTGSNRATSLMVRRVDLVASAGTLGVLPLDVEITPLPRSVLAQLGDVVRPDVATRTSSRTPSSSPSRRRSSPSATATARQLSLELGDHRQVRLLDARPPRRPRS